VHERLADVAARLDVDLQAVGARELEDALDYERMETAADPPAAVRLRFRCNRAAVLGRVMRERVDEQAQELVENERVCRRRLER